MNKNAIKDEFNTKISQAMGSAAFLDFCEEVYGYRTYLFNMMDKEQIDFLLNSDVISSADRILDLGCGAGSILKLMTEHYHCEGTGVDLLERDFFEIVNSKDDYICGDIENVKDFPVKPTITLSVDSLYFCDEPEQLIRDLAEMKNNTLYLFYSQYIFDEKSEEKSILKCENTRLAQILDKCNLAYSFFNFSENEHKLYVNMKRALLKYREAFEKEGNTAWYEQKLQEVEVGLELYEKGLASRYLYFVKAKEFN